MSPSEKLQKAKELHDQAKKAPMLKKETLYNLAFDLLLEATGQIIKRMESLQ